MKKHVENNSLRESITFDLRIPEAIDMETILKTNPPKYRFINRDNCLYLIDLIYKNGCYYSHDYFKYKRDGFIPLKAAYLRNIIPQYRFVLDYLIERNIIECDNRFLIGLYSKGYRIRSELLTGKYKKERFQYSNIYFKINSLLNETKRFDEYWKQKRSYLFRPFNNGSITINKEEAVKCLHDLIKGKYDELARFKISKEAYMQKQCDINQFYYLQLQKINRIIENDYKNCLKIDNTSYRFHSPITSLKKELRKFIKIDNEEVAEIDLKNSQPFFLLMLFKKEFMESRKRGTRGIRLIDIDYEYWEYIRHNSNRVIPYMIPKYGKTLENIDSSVLHFCNLIREGVLYDYFVKEYACYNPKRYGDDFKIMRNKIKKEILSFIYDTNRNDKLYGLRGFFKDRFPTITRVLRFMKSFEMGTYRKLRSGYNKKQTTSLIEVDEGFTKLVITLQRIESKIFLDRICNRLNNEFPELNFITIHDAIYVPKSKVFMTKGIVIEEIKNATFEMPIVDVS